MADVYSYILNTGVIVSDTSVINADVETEYQNTFGTNLVVTPNTPQGVLITAETAARVAVADNNAALANQINPNVAGGVFLDAIGDLTGSTRSPATPSTVTATFTGVSGTVIPMGSQVSDSVYNNVFQTTASVTILGGTASVLMESVEDGQIVAGASTLTQILSNVPGWETSTNASDAVLGSTTQSDESFRTERRSTLFSQGASTAGAIIAAVYNVENVTSMSFLENVAATTQTVSGVSMVSHSIYCCVNGGTNLAVATAIQSKKSAGASYNNGATGSGVNATPVSQVVVEPFSGQSITVLFDRPGIASVQVAISVRVTQPVQDPTTTVVTAILNYCNGLLDGFAGLVVGASVSPWEIAGAVTSQYPGIYVQSLQISSTTLSILAQYTEIPIAVWQMAVITSGDITVTVL